MNGLIDLEGKGGKLLLATVMYNDCDWTTSIATVRCMDGCKLSSLYFDAECVLSWQKCIMFSES